MNRKIKLNSEEYEEIEIIDESDCEDEYGISIKSFEKFVSNRNLYLFGIVNRKNILEIISQIHYCEKIDPDKEITLYINSEGGYIGDCFALIDVMDNCRCSISTVVLGSAASAACLIASNGTPGRRFSGKNSEFMYHETYGDIVEASHSKMQYYVNQFNIMQKKLDRIFKKNTGKSLNEIRDKFLSKSLDKYLSASEAKVFGIVDHILTVRKNKKGI